MTCILDTQALIYFFENAPALSPKAKVLIEDSRNDIYVSIASLWEMAIKISIGKLHPTRPLEEFFEQIQLQGIVLLPIQEGEVLSVSTLPMHHRDPFDRIIIAQAMTRTFDIISNDRAFDAYPVNRIW